jgi:recombination protein RecT
MTGAISNAVAARDEREASSLRAFVMRYRDEFTKVLPTHLQSAAEQETWLRLAVGSLKTGRMTGGEFDLEIAARNNPAAFMQALRKAASLGLQPGTEQFYLTPRRIKGRLEILGITGYQGIIELMYRAGYVASVVCEVVHEAERDTFRYMPGRDERPVHEVNWFAEDRGPAIGAYAYAIMHGGVTSRVIVLSETEIQEIRKRYSQGSDSEYSPWQTSPDAMRLKTVVRRLKAWVPTSVEVRGHNGLPVLPPAPVANLAAPAPAASLPVGQAPIPEHAQADPTDADEIVDGELVEDKPEAAPKPDDEPEPEPRSAAQQRTITTLMQQKQVGGGPPAREFVEKTLGIVVEDPGKLSSAQADRVIEALRKLADPAPVGT